MDTVDSTLDKKYRPTTLADVIGNDGTKEAIQVAIDRDQSFPASVLLSGPSGCGKTTLARIIATMLGASQRDVKQYNMSDTRGIDTARDINRMVKIRPLGGVRVIILNECHQTTKDFQNSMLEVLEEPPKNNHFILCTTEPKKLIHTIQTRCTRYPVSLLSSRDMKLLVSRVMKNEDVEVPDAVVAGVVEAADGSPRSALVLLDSIIDLPTEKAMLAVVASYTMYEQDVIDLCRVLLNKSSKWKDISDILKNLDRDDVEKYRRIILSYFEKVVLGGGAKADNVAMMMDFFTKSFFYGGRPELVQACWLAHRA